MSTTDPEQYIRVYDEETQQPQLVNRNDLNPCAKCGRQLRESKTGRYPHAEGHICQPCHDQAAEDFRQTIAGYNDTPPPENAMSVKEMIRRFL